MQTIKQLIVSLGLIPILLGCDNLRTSDILSEGGRKGAAQLAGSFGGGSTAGASEGVPEGSSSLPDGASAAAPSRDRGSLEGTMDTGGGSNLDGVVLESFIRDPTIKVAYRSVAKGILEM